MDLFLVCYLLCFNISWLSVHVIYFVDKMCKFDEELDIAYLPAPVYEQLVNELERNSNWIQLAEQVSKIGSFGSAWVRSFKDNGHAVTRGSSSENLLHELTIRLCNVGILCDLLEECNLLRALSILQHPEQLIIVKQPNHHATDIRIAFGGRLITKCVARGLPPPSYTWYHENLELQDQNSEELSILINDLEQEGEYKCMVSQVDCEGSILDERISEAICLVIEPTPIVIEIQPLSFLEIGEDESVILTCKVHSHPVPKYQWYRDNTQLKTQNSHQLEIKKFSPSDEGKYYCHIKNEISEVYTQKSSLVMKPSREKAVAKIALLIANEDYDNLDKLKTPKNDVAKLAQLLSEIGFRTICFVNLTTEQTKNAMRIFCSLLSDGVYGLFYYAGHGFKMQESYMLAIDAPKSFLRSDAICESELLAMIVPMDPALLVVILDTCQTVPPKELNPDIHKEIPTVNEYRSRKNLRNLIQAYSTSSHRPSYERLSTDSGLYVSHLCKYIVNDIPVQKVFEEVGKSIDTWFKGKERNQIPMFALTVTKPYRLTDVIYAINLPENLSGLNSLIDFPIKFVDVIFEPNGIEAKLMVSQQMKPYLNSIKLSFQNIDNLSANFYNYTPIGRNNLFRSSIINEFRVHNPQTSRGPLVISVERNGIPIGASKFQIMEYLPAILRQL